MTAEEYRAALTALGLTYAGAARLLGVDDRTSRRWANDERKVDPTVARFLRLLIAKGISADDALAALDGQADTSR
jgi:transcriptional regulator with XRE-family HTH domain